MTQTQAENQPWTSDANLKIGKRVGIGIAVLVILVCLFGVLGYYWLPGYAKSQLELRLTELLDRPVSVREIEVKPYTLELIVSDFRIGERQDGIDAAETFVSFETLHVDISSESIARRAPVLSTITLDALRVRLTREDERQFNISDLVEKFSQPSDDEEDADALFSISNIVLKNGYIEWVDRFEQTRQEVSEINFAVPFVANLDTVKADWIEPHFNAKINGAPISLAGKLRPFTNQREATLDLKLDNIDLTRITGYVPFPVGINLASGFFDSDLTVTFSESDEGEPAMTLSGKAALQNVAVTNKAVQVPYQFDLGGLYLGLDAFDLTGRESSSLALSLADVKVSPLSSRGNSDARAISLQKLVTHDLTIDVSNQQVALDSVVVDDLATRIHREAGGHIDLVRLFTPSDSDVTVVSEASGRVLLVPKPRKKPSAEAYDAWLQANQDNTLQEESLQAAAPVLPLPARKPSYEVWAEQAAQLKAERTDDTGSWAVRINRFQLNNAAIYYADLTLIDVPPMVVKPLDLTVSNIDITGVEPLALDLKARVNEHGTIEANGQMAWMPLTADLNLNLQAVDLVALQGWGGDALNVLLTSGDFSFQGAVKAEGEPLKVAVNGESRLGHFNLFDQNSGRDMLSWEYLDVAGLNVVNDPLSIDMDTVKLGDFFCACDVVA